MALPSWADLRPGPEKEEGHFDMDYTLAGLEKELARDQGSALSSKPLFFFCLPSSVKVLIRTRTAILVRDICKARVMAPDPQPASPDPSSSIPKGPP